MSQHEGSPEAGPSSEPLLQRSSLQARASAVTSTGRTHMPAAFKDAATINASPPKRGASASASNVQQSMRPPPTRISASRSYSTSSQAMRNAIASPLASSSSQPIAAPSSPFTPSKVSPRKVISLSNPRPFRQPVKDKTKLSMSPETTPRRPNHTRAASPDPLLLTPTSRSTMDGQRQATPGSSTRASARASTANHDAIDLTARKRPRKARERIGPFNKANVVLYISRRRRDELISRGVYDPFRDDWGQVDPPVRTRGLRPWVSKGAVHVSDSGMMARIKDPEDIPDRFIVRSGPAVKEPWASVLTKESLLNRVDEYRCGWKGCTATLASEALLALHVRKRAHAVQGVIDGGYYRCYWMKCTGPCFDTISELIQHMTAVHISKWLQCPYECDLRSPTVSHLQRHVLHHHSDTVADIPVPRADKPWRPPLKPLPALPAVAFADELTTMPARGSWYALASRKEQVRAKVQRNCFGGDDPVIHFDHPPPMMKPLEGTETIAVSDAEEIKPDVELAGVVEVDENGVPVGTGSVAALLMQRPAKRKRKKSFWVNKKRKQDRAPRAAPAELYPGASDVEMEEDADADDANVDPNGDDDMESLNGNAAAGPSQSHVPAEPKRIRRLFEVYVEIPRYRSVKRTWPLKNTVFAPFEPPPMKRRARANPAPVVEAGPSARQFLPSASPSLPPLSPSSPDVPRLFTRRRAGGSVVSVSSDEGGVVEEGVEVSSASPSPPAWEDARSVLASSVADGDAEMEEEEDDSAEEYEEEVGSGGPLLERVSGSASPALRRAVARGGSGDESEEEEEVEEVEAM